MLRALRSGKGVGAAHPAWWDSIAMHLPDLWTPLDPGKKKTKKHSPCGPQGIILVWLIDAGFILSTTVLSQLTFPCCSLNQLGAAGQEKEGWNSEGEIQSELGIQIPQVPLEIPAQHPACRCLTSFSRKKTASPGIY